MRLKYGQECLHWYVQNMPICNWYCFHFCSRLNFNEVCFTKSRVSTAQEQKVCKRVSQETQVTKQKHRWITKNCVRREWNVKRAHLYPLKTYLWELKHAREKNLQLSTRNLSPSRRSSLTRINDLPSKDWSKIRTLELQVIEEINTCRDFTLIRTHRLCVSQHLSSFTSSAR